MKKLLTIGLCSCLLSACSSSIPSTDSSDVLFEPDMNQVLVETIVLNDKMKIEHYQTTYLHNIKQILKEDYLDESSILPYERIGAENLVFIGFDDSKVDELNEEIKEKHENYINSVVYVENNSNYVNWLKEFDFVFYDIYKNDDITSIVETSNHILSEAGGMPYQYRIFNIDNQTGKLLSNQEVIKDFEALNQMAVNQLNDLGYVPLYDFKDFDYETFYYGIGLENEPMEFILPISDSSFIYKKNNRFHLILEIYRAGINDYMIKLELPS